MTEKGCTMRQRCFLKSWVLATALVGMSFILLPLEAHARNIKVGIIDCYSGPPAVYARDALNGFKLALKEINKKDVLGRKKEGLLRQKIEFTTRDTKFKVGIALNMAKELVMREHVDVLVGTINSGAALAVSENVAMPNKVPFIVWISKSENITGKKGNRYAFSTGENTAMAGKAGGVALSRKPYVNYWIAGDDYEYGHAIGKAAWDNLKALKPDVKVIGESWWKPGEPNLTPYITAILAAKPDAVIFCTGGASMTNIMKAIKTTGMAKKVPIWIHTAIDYGVDKPLGLEGPEGVMGTTDYLFYYPDTPENKAFDKAYEAAYGDHPGFSAFHGYITARFIAQAFKKAGSLNKEKFIDALEGLKVKSPAGGEVEMRACDHQAVLPEYFGITAVSPTYKFLIAKDIVTLTGAEVMPSCADVMKMRGK